MPHPNKSNAAGGDGDGNNSGGGGAAPFHTRSTTRASSKQRPLPTSRTFYKPSVHQFTCRGAFHLQQKQNGPKIHNHNNDALNSKGDDNNDGAELEALIKDADYVWCNGIQSKLRHVADYPLAVNKEMAIRWFEGSSPMGINTSMNNNNNNNNGSRKKFYDATLYAGCDATGGGDPDANVNGNTHHGNENDDVGIESVDIQPERTFSSYGTTQVNILTLQKIPLPLHRQPEDAPFPGFGALTRSANPFSSLFHSGGMIDLASQRLPMNYNNGGWLKSPKTVSSTKIDLDENGKRVVNFVTTSTTVDGEGKQRVETLTSKRHMDDEGRLEATRVVRTDGNFEHVKSVIDDKNSAEDSGKRDENGKRVAKNVTVVEEGSYLSHDDLDENGKRVAKTVTTSTTVDGEGKQRVWTFTTETHLDDGGRVENTYVRQIDGNFEYIKCATDHRNSAIHRGKRDKSGGQKRYSTQIDLDENGKRVIKDVITNTTLDGEGKQCVKTSTLKIHVDDGGRVDDTYVRKTDGIVEYVESVIDNRNSANDSGKPASKDIVMDSAAANMSPMFPQATDAAQQPAPPAIYPTEVLLIATDGVLGVSVFDSFTHDPDRAVPQPATTSSTSKNKDGNVVGWHKSQYLFRLGRFIRPFIIVDGYYQDKEEEERRRKDMQKEYNDMRDRMKKNRWDKSSQKDTKESNTNNAPISDNLSAASSRTEYYLQRICVQMNKNLNMMGVLLNEMTKPEFPKKVQLRGEKIVDNMGPTMERTGKLMRDVWDMWWMGWSGGAGNGKGNGGGRGRGNGSGGK